MILKQHYARRVSSAHTDKLLTMPRRLNLFRSRSAPATLSTSTTTNANLNSNSKTNANSTKPAIAQILPRAIMKSTMADMTHKIVPVHKLLAPWIPRNPDGSHQWQPEIFVPVKLLSGIWANDPLYIVFGVLAFGLAAKVTAHYFENFTDKVTEIVFVFTAFSVQFLFVEFENRLPSPDKFIAINRVAPQVAEPEPESKTTTNDPIWPCSYPVPPSKDTESPSSTTTTTTTTTTPSTSRSTSPTPSSTPSSSASTPATTLPSSPEPIIPLDKIIQPKVLPTARNVKIKFEPKPPRFSAFSPIPWQVTAYVQDFIPHHFNKTNKFFGGNIKRETRAEKRGRCGILNDADDYEHAEHLFELEPRARPSEIQVLRNSIYGSELLIKDMKDYIKVLKAQEKKDRKKAERAAKGTIKASHSRYAL